MDLLILLSIGAFLLISIILVWLNVPGNFLFLLFISIIEYFRIIDLVSYKTLIAIFVIYILIEIIEFFLSALVIKIYGGVTSSSYLSLLGTIIGTIIGTILFPIIGSMIGLIGGAYIVTYYNEKNSGKNSTQAIQIANSSILGFVLSKGLKTLGLLLFTAYLLL